MEHPYPSGTKVRVVNSGVSNHVSVGDILTVIGSESTGCPGANYIYQTDGPMLFDYRVVPVEELKEEE